MTYQDQDNLVDANEAQVRAFWGVEPIDATSDEPESHLVDEGSTAMATVGCYWVLPLPRSE